MRCIRDLGRPGPALAVLVTAALLLTPAGWAAGTFKTLYRFTPGGWTAGLIIDQGGNLYGTTTYGGSEFEGTIFELTPGSDGSWTKKLLHTFTGGDDGGYPASRLILEKSLLRSLRDL
jgi:uncharacterized repeat protein (TIGR03803 family)